MWIMFWKRVAVRSWTLSKNWSFVIADQVKMPGIMNKLDIFEEEKLYQLHFGASNMQGVYI